MQKTSLLIPIHSMVDLITNSSSEIFVAVKGSAAATIVKIIDGILAAGGSDKKCSDLFKVEVGEAYEDEKEWDIPTVYLTKSEVAAYKKQGLLLTDDDDCDDEDDSDSVDDTDAAAEEESKGRYRKYENEYGYEQSRIIVTPLTDEGKDVAKVLSALENLFNIDATNG